MNGLPSSRCLNCGTEFGNTSAKTCPNCGRVRAELTTSGFSEPSYRVTTKFKQQIGPVPISTIAQMLQDGAIDYDTPIRDESAGKVFFADEHPMLRSLIQSPPQVAQSPPPQSPRPSTPLVPVATDVYCPSCRGKIKSSDVNCPLCGAPTSTRVRIAQEEALRAQQEQERQAQRQQQLEESQQAKYHIKTGHGICPNCKSPNVLKHEVTEGESKKGKTASVALGLIVTPVAFLALPFMAGKKYFEYECAYCTNRWRL